MVSKPSLGSKTPAALVAALALACSGCLFTSSPTIQTTGYFHDVGNLVSGAPVEMAGITIGSVQSISLKEKGDLAEVVMTIDKSADVPANVTAEVEQSTVLGEEVVQLVALSGSKGGAKRLVDNSTISRTATVPGIQQFVSGGTAVLGSIGTSQLASLIDAGGQGLGGEGETLRSLIKYLDNITTGYSTRTTEVRSLVLAMDRLSTSLAPHAQANAEALARLATAVGIISKDSGNFVGMLQGLDHLAIQGRSIMEQQMSEIDLQFRGLATLASTLAGQQQAIAELLAELPGHNTVMHDAVVNHFAQIVDALILCGLPNGGGNTSQAASTCYGAGAVTGPGAAPLPSTGSSGGTGS